jgi:hypothetical protein
MRQCLWPVCHVFSLLGTYMLFALPPFGRSLEILSWCPLPIRFALLCPVNYRFQRLWHGLQQELGLWRA